MDEKSKDTPDTAEPERPQQPREEKPVLEAGEKAFTIVLLAMGLLAFGLALGLWLRMDEPRIASAGALPLFVTGLWVVLAFLSVIENRKLTSP